MNPWKWKMNWSCQRLMFWSCSCWQSPSCTSLRLQRCWFRLLVWFWTNKQTNKQIRKVHLTLVPHQAWKNKALSETVPLVHEVVCVKATSQRHCAVTSSSLLDVSSSLQSLLPSDLVLVELGEVVDNDGDGQGDAEYPADGTSWE